MSDLINNEIKKIRRSLEKQNEILSEIGENFEESMTAFIIYLLGGKEGMATYAEHKRKEKEEKNETT